ncbi:hypothetical protein MPPM_4308 [Methylorubrum populi]|uniref:Uncharacterized protein n=1 Tax=Methylorubrum populi TaxID=223967 RepID=A0A160PK10_9HYPH|nr:hypothetical protein MPPM_4308 [Methylorubrum populi]
MGREGNEEEKDEEAEAEEKEAEGRQKHVDRHRVPKGGRSRQAAGSSGSSNVTFGPARHKHPRRRVPGRGARAVQQRTGVHRRASPDAGRSHPGSMMGRSPDMPCNIVTSGR